MIVYRCLGCGKPDLPIEALRCPKCGEENFIPLNRPLSAPEFRPEPINDTNNFCDASTEYIGEANTTMTDCRSNQYEQTELMVKDISVSSEEHVDGLGRTYVEAEMDEGAETINLRCQHFDLKQEQQSQINSIDPVLRSGAFQEIPNAYDQACSFNVEDNDVGVSASVNFSSTVSAHPEESQNGMNSSRQPQSKWQNQSNFEVADDVDELAKFKNEDGTLDFSGCKKCFNKFLEEYFAFNAHLQSECDPKPYKCEKCLCSFDKPVLLKSHSVVHMEEKPFKCEQCGKTFKRRSELKIHVCRYLCVHTEK